MPKLKTLMLCVLCTLQIGCSLAPSAANRSFKAYDAGDYKESLRLVNRALSTYEYPVEQRANLLFLKADNYAQLHQYVYAQGVIIYLIKTYPDTEAAYKAKSLLSSISKVLPKKPAQKAPKSKKYSTDISST